MCWPDIRWRVTDNRRHCRPPELGLRPVWPEGTAACLNTLF
jgi:hypothetical protein